MTIAADTDYDALFPGRFVKAGEFKGRDVTMTISDISLEEMEDKRKGKVTKVILSFKEVKKQILANKTNCECLKGMFGRKPAAWVGKRVTFYPETVKAFGVTKPAIRVRGSPDIAQDLNIVCQIGTDAITVTMKKTAVRQGSGKQKAAPEQPPEPPPEMDMPDDADPETGEVPFA